MKKYIVVFLSLATLFTACKKDEKTETTTNNPPTTTTVTDFDGNIYKTVTIGTQVWMAENLKATHYRNGDAIPNVTDSTQWIQLSSGAYCCYYNDTANQNIYGNLYNWYAVNDNRGLAPQGWHIPSKEEWLVLIDYLGGKDVAGGKLKETGTTHWQSPNTGATNESGFNALPGGVRNWEYGEFLAVKEIGTWYSSTETTNTSCFELAIDYNLTSIHEWNGYPKNNALSIRCIKD